MVCANLAEQSAAGGRIWHRTFDRGPEPGAAIGVADVREFVDEHVVDEIRR